MPSLRHASPRRPRRGAQRRAGAVETGRHRGMRRSEDARAQPRPSSLGRGQARCGPPSDRHRPIPPFCVTTVTPSPANGYGCGDGPRLAQFRPGFLRPLQLQRKVRYDGIHGPYFSAVFRGWSPGARARPPRRLPQRFSAVGASRGRRYVGIPARIGTGSPARLGQVGPVGGPCG